jgi:hypothetical protein
VGPGLKFFWIFEDFCNSYRWHSKFLIVDLLTDWIFGALLTPFWINTPFWIIFTLNSHRDVGCKVYINIIWINWIFLFSSELTENILCLYQNVWTFFKNQLFLQKKNWTIVINFFNLKFHHKNISCLGYFTCKVNKTCPLSGFKTNWTKHQKSGRLPKTCTEPI